MLRRITETLAEDTEVRKQFELLPAPNVFEKEHVGKVFHAYLRRVETMMGNEYAHQLMEQLLLNKNNTLGSLRQVKRGRDKEVKGLKVGIVDNEVVSKPSSSGNRTSKRKRRKPKKMNL